MVNLNLIRGLDLNEDNWDLHVTAALGGSKIEEREWGGQEVVPNEILSGTIVRVEHDFVIVDVGYKSEGIVPRSDWDEDEEPPTIGATIKVLVEEYEEEGVVVEAVFRGMINLS